MAGFVCQVDTGWSYHRERCFSWGSASMRSNCGAFSQLVIMGRGPLLDGAIAGLVVLGYIKEQAEQARGSKPARNIPPCPLHQQLLMQRPWRDVSYWLASSGLLSLLSYRTQEHQPRDGTTYNGPSHLDH